ncbi:hypothetical protein [Marivirga sp.]|uniref:hypothetical protein n=1 Tax=Marivirga sp. TaxID=2018662 RepID=UPI002D803FC5|nr:hypothetical protein [Marivirga sp.]HET8859383.1 hypothetical protein [Marivirga sp.]
MNKAEDRLKIPSAEIKIGTKEIEAFQNETLRPIIKKLHSLLLNHFSVLLFTKKSEYFRISEDKKGHYIHSIFQTENRYKSELKGMIIGNFTIQEYKVYSFNPRMFDKRIYSIVEERILTNQSELDDLR